MVEAVPDCLVRGYETLIDGLKLPDPNDRHVLAAAIRAGAQVIVTSNLKDFPEADLTAYHVDAQDPDDFVSHLIDLAPGAVCGVVTEQAAALKNPARTVDEILDRLGAQGMPQSAAQIRDLLH